MDDSNEPVDTMQETPADGVFMPPSIDRAAIERGASYTYRSAIPALVASDMTTPCVLGVDEAGRGPVLGPMVYGLLYLPLTLHRSLLAETHRFDDSKVLTPEVRSRLLERLCDGGSGSGDGDANANGTSGSDLFGACGWSVRVMSARDIAAGMLRPVATYNLNNQAMDATIALIQEVFDAGVHVAEIYIDTIGSPAVYQRKLERIFPATKITVAKKADSLYPCVSAASVCAKVTRDAALEVAYRCSSGGGALSNDAGNGAATAASGDVVGWGSGYPSDARCTGWMKAHMDPLFGWGNECRFSWSTARDLLDDRARAFRVDWPAPDDDDDTTRVTDFFRAGGGEDGGDLASWYGRPAAEAAF